MNGQISLVSRLKQRYNIEAINVCGREALEKAGMQIGCYRFMYNYIKENFTDIEWIAYIDIDEFFDFNSMKANQFLT